MHGRLDGPPAAGRSSAPERPSAPEKRILEALAEGSMAVLRHAGVASVTLAAEAVNARQIAFLADEARGIIQLALTPERCRQLALPTSPDGSGHMAVSVGISARGAADGGGSARDLAQTVRMAVDPATAPEDLLHHGVLLTASTHPGGVLGRRERNEAAVDLARLSGRPPAAVVCQLLSRDGSPLDDAGVAAFCRRSGLPECGLQDVVYARMRTERFLKRDVEALIPTTFGNFTFVGYRSTLDGRQHLAAVMGDHDSDGDPVLVHVHAACLLGDALGATCCTSGAELREAMERIAAAGRGMILYLTREDERLEQLGGCAATGSDVCRDGVGVGAEVLRDLGATRVRLLGASSRTASILERYGVDIVERLPLGST